MAKFSRLIFSVITGTILCASDAVNSAYAQDFPETGWLPSRNRDLPPPGIGSLIFGPSMHPPSAYKTGVGGKGLDAYYVYAQDLLHRAWTPPASKKEVTANAEITILNDGTTSSIKIFGNDAPEEFKDSIEQVIKAVKFAPLPPKDLGQVTLLFTFTYTPEESLPLFYQFMPRVSTNVTHPETNICAAVSGQFDQVFNPEELSRRTLEMSAYLFNVAKQIKTKWTLMDDEASKRQSISFEINRDGSISNLMRVVTGNNTADEKAIEAIESSAPFSQLPEEAEDKIKVVLKVNSTKFGAGKEQLDFTVHEDRRFDFRQAGPISQELSNDRKQLDSLWSVIAKKTDRPLLPSVLLVRLDNSGRLTKEDKQDSIEIYTSTGTPAIDNILIETARQMEPFNLHKFHDGPGNYLLEFDFFSKSARLKTRPQLDWRPFLTSLQDRISQRWFPSRVDQTGNVEFNFSVDKKGRISNLKMTREAGDKDYQEAARKAIISSGPLWDLPDGAPDSISVDCLLGFTPLIPETFASTGRVKSTNPHLASLIHEQMGDAYRDCGKYSKAIEQYALAARLHESSAIEIKIGQIYLLKGDHEGAEAHFKLAQSFCPSLPAFMFGSHSKDSEPDWKSSWDSLPLRSADTPEGRLANCKYLVFIGHYDAARMALQSLAAHSLGPIYKAAVEMLKQLSPAEQRCKLYNLQEIGRFALLKKNYKAAEQALLQALVLNPPEVQKENLPILNQLGRAYQESGEPTKAAEYFHKALSIDPANQEALSGIAKPKISPK